MNKRKRKRESERERERERTRRRGRRRDKGTATATTTNVRSNGRTKERKEKRGKNSLTDDPALVADVGVLLVEPFLDDVEWGRWWRWRGASGPGERDEPGSERGSLFVVFLAAAAAAAAAAVLFRLAFARRDEPGRRRELPREPAPQHKVENVGPEAGYVGRRRRRRGQPGHGPRGRIGCRRRRRRRRH